MLRWQQTEFLLKGLYLGLLVMVAWLQPTWPELGRVAAVALVTGGAIFAAAAWNKMREGYRSRGRLVGFILFLLLENPGAVYASVLVGLLVGAYSVFGQYGAMHDPSRTVPNDAYIPLLGGVGLGILFYLLRTVRDARLRTWLGLALAAGLIGAVVAFLYFNPEVLEPRQLQMLGVVLLLGIPGFYLLTFASLVEESEVEIAAICAALGAAGALLAREGSPMLQALAIALPCALYYVYTKQVLPGLRVFKHALRGISYWGVGNVPAALASLTRALQLAPNHELARQQLWEIHRKLDYTQLQNQPEVLALIDFNLCLERVAALLLRDRPSAEQLKEAEHLLDLVYAERPMWRPVAAYWRAVAATHQRQFDRASEQLLTILQVPAIDSEARRRIHFAAWQLALLLHPELKKRVGEPLLGQTGACMDAIAAAERELFKKPGDPVAVELQRLLYSRLTEADYQAAPPAAGDFNHDYVRQLGLALVEDPAQWQRGCAYLRMAAHGLPAQTAGLLLLAADIHDRAGDTAGMWEHNLRALQLGRAIGLDAVPSDQQDALFLSVKKVGERAASEDQVDIALEAYKFLTHFPKVGIATYRALADLFERKQDVWQALKATELGLSYMAADKELMERKDRYTYSIQPDDLRARWDNVRSWFDTKYCLDKARQILDQHRGDFELLDWASHLADLALVASPTGIAARLTRARILRQRGEGAQAIEVLESIRQNKPEKFASEDESKAWYQTHRLLADLYLDSKPADALACLLEFRNSDQSGADTYYKMGRVYENLGDYARAIKCYEQLNIFPQHPLYYDSRAALDRVRQMQQTQAQPKA